jgi:8-oxo-dGTP pyrophosphatase MutT (NUDIX family)
LLWLQRGTRSSQFNDNYWSKNVERKVLEMAEKKYTSNTVSTYLEKDQSFGIIPLRKKENDWDVFIIKHKAGHLGFPKGHLINEHEKPKEAAERELQEETGLVVKSYYALEPIQVNYECVSHGKHYSDPQSQDNFSQKI